MGDTCRRTRRSADEPNLTMNVERCSITEDPEETMLARYAEGKAAIAIRRFDHSTWIYVTPPDGLDA